MHFLGARRDLGNILAAIDMFVMPSLWEGLPLSLVLAMGAGLPVVASRVAGIPEVVKDGVSGLLVDAGDSHQLAPRAGARWCTTAQLRARLGAAATAFVLPRFGVDGYVASVTDALRSPAGGEEARDARHPVSHAVLAGRRRHLWEAEGSFARYVDSLAPYFDEIVLVRAGVRHAAGVGIARARGQRHAGAAAVLPGPAAVLSEAAVDALAAARVGRCSATSSICACRRRRRSSRFASPRRRRKPVFLLVVGDYEALLPHLPYRGIKKLLFGRYVAFEDGRCAT